MVNVLYDQPLPALCFWLLISVSCPSYRDIVTVIVDLIDVYLLVLFSNTGLVPKPACQVAETREIARQGGCVPWDVVVVGVGRRRFDRRRKCYQNDIAAHLGTSAHPAATPTGHPAPRGIDVRCPAFRKCRGSSAEQHRPLTAEGARPRDQLGLHGALHGPPPGGRPGTGNGRVGPLPSEMNENNSNLIGTNISSFAENGV